jgi:predicted O-linked N-acetylglucosamine transferase (SPINDLY family)
VDERAKANLQREAGAEAAIESPLFDAQAYARAFEDLLPRLWREAPAAFAGGPSAGVQ